MKPTLEKLIEETIAERTPAELALGWLRYETLRRLSPRKFTELNNRNLSGENFDEMITNELLAWKETK